MNRSHSLNEAQGWNRREFTRVPLDLEAEIQLGPKTAVTGRTRDLSLKGVFLRCAERPALGETCTATVHFAGRNSDYRVKATGRVARTEPSGIGIEFLSLEAESYEHLKNLVYYNTPDPAGVQREFASHIGLKRRAA